MVITKRPPVAATEVSSVPETGRAGGARMRMRAALALSVLVLVMMAVASAAGLVVDGLYRDPAPVASMLRGYDLVTLVVAVPALGLALLGVLRGSVAAQLVWVGMLAYAGYTYAIYVFGTAFNNLFLAHVAVFSSSVYALALALSALDVAGVARRFNPRTPARWIAGLLALLALGLGGMWIFYSLRFAMTGDAPVGSALVETPTIVHLGYALDLSLLVPAYALAAVLLWRRAAWGYILAAAVLVSGTVHQVGYLVALPFQVDAGVAGASAFDPGEPPIAVAFLIATIVLLAGLRRPSPGARPRRAAPVPDR